MSPGRRSFLLGALAAFTAPALPASAPVAPPPPPPLQAAGGLARAEFGFKLNNRELWTTGYSTREEAMEAARKACAYDGCGAEVGRVEPHSMTHSDYAEAIAEHFLNEEGPEFGPTLMSALEGANQDSDYEGDFADSIYRLGPDELNEPARAAVAAAFRRQGLEALAEMILLNGSAGIEELGEQVTEALAKDKELGDELEALMDAWATRHDLEPDLRSLYTMEVEQIPAPPGAVAV